MKVEINRVYKHFKGDSYLVVDIAKHSETMEEHVIYRELYGEGNLYIRPVTMFLEKVDKKKYPDVLQEYRFELQDIKSTR